MGNSPYEEHKPVPRDAVYKLKNGIFDYHKTKMKNLIRYIGVSFFAIFLIFVVAFVVKKVYATSSGNKALIEQVVTLNSGGGNNGSITIGLYDSADQSFKGEFNLSFSLVGVNDSNDYRTAVINAIVAWSVANSKGVSEEDIVWPSVPPLLLPSPVSRSIVTGTGATGFQVSGVRDADVRYNATIAVTTTIGGASDGILVLEIAPTNSATPGDWVEIARIRNSQALSLALVLQSVQTISGQLSGFVPRGYYAKIRSITNSGSPTFTYNSGQEVLF